MHFASIVFLGGLISAVSAHFHLEYPGPRGPFVESSEPNFCDDYGEVTTNRTTFPLNNGHYLFKSEHPDWTMGVMISTVSNPNNFANFTDSKGNYQMAVNYFSTSGEGEFCAPINISAAGIDGIKDGANVTLQFVFSAGDGNLYQCADVTLSEDETDIPSDVTCKNDSTNAVTTFSSGAIPTASQASTSASASATTTQSAADARAVVGVSGLLLSVFGGLLALA
ncbi:hypothetical protein FOMPIDRAFT_1021892 [Fomitopsis schrenkii]|uniref:Copper acquisition factor BIM1-like domain-containing protein n=1 Tax=Fomitopsis schrenkii TaxID=2126942 RepID=S8ELE6_FOMSC|nr:hypothetical protein FOMPIDRAFT_1021892 [Fomitopsis schrenkii]